MEFNDLTADCTNYELMGWHCSLCGWRYEKDVRLADIDALAFARAEFLNHACNAAANNAMSGM
jgi:hypothetical protein